MTLHRYKLPWANGLGFTPCSAEYASLTAALAAIQERFRTATPGDPAAAHRDEHLGVRPALWAKYQHLVQRHGQLIAQGHVRPPVRLIYRDGQRVAA
jgi:hypothetical protein